ncbi:MAG: mannose-1-phosphate guanylyltransferase [Candidatus Marinimicrobia bacterium]|nr:mannose-1-phosphate guanylyltransferase [Candidatus Neomarinimicrobiota bacterium]MCF7828686.1 mannose-1-phosphate guanylyltransferase [Candidatus Neomarinimicrobiota bacterium]MCF7880427.1 mannose-1-phosphate guanylyltransferase [Candidatus Neomarinimicrobiota bacterium]
MYSVIMAGGVGKRFWPRSRKDRPKQLLNIVDDASMLRLTVDRLNQVSDYDKIFIVTNHEQAPAIKKNIPELPEENLLLEPFGKNTAPAIALSAVHILDMDPDAVMAVFPADHLIMKEDVFFTDLEEAEKAVRDKNCLVTFGIEPTRPATGYGYIQYDTKKTLVEDKVYKVKTFAEKPNLNTARRFLRSGDFLWNSGMFVWKAKTILQQMKAFMPELYDSAETISESLGSEDYHRVVEREWKTLRSESIDYGIMEKAGNVYVVRGEFFWSDLGSWASVYELAEKDDQENVIDGDAMLLDSTGNYIYSPDRFVATVGLEDTIIINTENVTLVVERSKAEDVKNLVDALRKKGRDEFL